MRAWAIAACLQFLFVRSCCPHRVFVPCRRSCRLPSLNARCATLAVHVMCLAQPHVDQLADLDLLVAGGTRASVPGAHTSLFRLPLLRQREVVVRLRGRPAEVPWRPSRALPPQPDALELPPASWRAEAPTALERTVTCFALHGWSVAHNTWHVSGVMIRAWPTSKFARSR